MKSWYEIYSERMNEQYRAHVANKYSPFLLELQNIEAKTSLEIGCGAGTITRILRDMTGPYQQVNSRYTLIDSCPKMLGLAIENNPASNCTFICDDIRKSSYHPVELVHSHGLLEHFDDNGIRRIVHNSLLAAPIQLHYVPSIEYKTPSRGDERLLHPDEWREILSPFRKVQVKTFNSGLDIILRIER